jgi:hypothetical protein
MQRFAELEQRLTSASRPPQAQPAAAPPPAGTVQCRPSRCRRQPACPPPAPPSARGTGAPVGRDAARDRRRPWRRRCPQPVPPAPALTRPRTLGRSRRHEQVRRAATPRRRRDRSPHGFHLPAGELHARHVLLGGLDAPTGGQSQSNPHPVLIRLSDNSVLPNRFRGEYRECFVIAAGYGDISSERAYLRTENLSCVRADGATLEVKHPGQRLRRRRQGRHARPARHQAGPDARQRAAGRRGQRHRPGPGSPRPRPTAPRRSAPSPAPPAMPTPTARASAPASARRWTGSPSTTSSWPRTPSR